MSEPQSVPAEFYEHEIIIGAPAPVIFLPLMTKSAREVEKGTKYLPEVWKPNG